MNGGLQIFDAQGVNVLDSGTRTVKIIKKITYRVTNEIIINDLFVTATPFVIIQPQPTNTSASVVFNGNRCTVNNGYTPPDTATIYIGVY